MKVGDRMKKSWLKPIILVASVCLIAINLYLIFKSSSKIERSAYVKGWTAVIEGDIKQTLNKKGIVSPEEDYYYYYDPKKGALKQFHVKEGEEVIEGAPLFEYDSTENEVENEKLEAEKEKIENQMSALRNHLNELARYKNSLSFTEDEKQAELSIVHSVEKNIYDAELKLEWLQQDFEKLEREIQLMKEKQEKMTVVSDVEGIVKEINEKIDNPLMTISSTIPVIKGHLYEEERYKVEDGMQAIISSEHMKEKMNGTLFGISHLPASFTPENGSEYSFTVHIDDIEANELFQGTHVEVSIITEAIDGALLVPKKTIVKEKKKTYIWIITTSGLLEKREIKTGLSYKNKIQIQSGVEKGELVVSKPDKIQKGEGPTFITPLDFTKLEISEIKKMRKKEISKYILKGILLR